MIKWPEISATPAICRLPARPHILSRLMSGEPSKRSISCQWATYGRNDLGDTVSGHVAEYS